jgi:hypothetical protein
MVKSIIMVELSLVTKTFDIQDLERKMEMISVKNLIQGILDWITLENL